ncbi:MAG: copper chaperone PCu(A)C [Rhizobacter sp.]|nr:copper chaperone PCu(A)C [Rhizobacter sp.]
MNLNRWVGAMALLVAAITVHAAEVKIGAITIVGVYARATVAGQAAGGGYLTIVNKGDDDRLLAASADVSSAVEMHSMNMDGSVMRMRQIDAVEVSAGKTVELKPGGMHLMFTGLKAPLRSGESFPLRLKFEKAGEVIVQVKVQAAGGHDSMHKRMKH